MDKIVIVLQFVLDKKYKFYDHKKLQHNNSHCHVEILWESFSAGLLKHIINID